MLHIKKLREAFPVSKKLLLLCLFVALLGMLLMIIPKHTAKTEKVTTANTDLSYSEDDVHNMIQMIGIIMGDSSPSVYLRKGSNDEIIGIAVFCSGGDDKVKQLSLLNFLKSAIGISSNHVYIGNNETNDNRK